MTSAFLSNAQMFGALLSWVFWFRVIFFLGVSEVWVWDWELQMLYNYL